jgi:hypothetical protein
MHGDAPTLPPRSSSASSNVFFRAIAAMTLAKLKSEDAEEIFERAFGRSEAASLIIKASVTPLSTTTGSQFAGVARTTLLTGLSQGSAAFKLFAKCMRLDFDGFNQVIVPVVTTSQAPIFVPEGNPGNIVQEVLGSVTFGPPNKLLFGVVVTAELQQYAVDTATTILGKALIEKAASTLDAAVFDANAASAGVRSAGLLNGVSDIGTPTAGGGIGAVATDLGRLAGAIGAAGISIDDVWFIMNPRQAIAARILAPSFPNIIATPAIPAATVVAVAPNAIASGYSGEPEIDISSDGAVHLEGATPAAISTSPGVFASPVSSLYQANLLGVKVRTRCCWGSLVTGAVQKLLSVTW